MKGIYSRDTEVSTIVDNDADFIVNKTSTIRHSLFGICFSHTVFKGDNTIYEGEDIIKKEPSLGFGNKKN